MTKWRQMTPRDRYRSLRLRLKALGILPHASTAQTGEPGHHAYALTEAAAMRHRVWLYGQTPRLRKQALEFHAMYLQNARLAR